MALGIPFRLDSLLASSARVSFISFNAPPFSLLRLYRALEKCPASISLSVKLVLTSLYIIKRPKSFTNIEKEAKILTKILLRLKKSKLSK